MLLIWPAGLPCAVSHSSVERALIWSILGGYSFACRLGGIQSAAGARDGQGLDPESQRAVDPAVCDEATGASVALRRAWPSFWSVGLVLSAIPTVLTNSDPILFEVLRDADPIMFMVDQLPGQSVRDIGSVLIAQVLTMVPFLLARQFLASEEGLRESCCALMVGALIYSVPVVDRNPA